MRFPPPIHRPAIPLAIRQQDEVQQHVDELRSGVAGRAGERENAGVHDGYDMLPGSAFEVEFGDPYDPELLTDFLHHFDVKTCVELLKNPQRSA
jgi:hypothetical protein